MAENQKTVTYKEKRGRRLFVPGYGVSDDKGMLVTTNLTPLENPNFELVNNAAPVAEVTPAVTPKTSVNNVATDTPVAPTTQNTKE